MGRQRREERQRLRQARREIISRYAKQRKDGRGPILCTPSRAEATGAAPMREASGNTGKGQLLATTCVTQPLSDEARAAMTALAKAARDRLEAAPP